MAAKKKIEKKLMKAEMRVQIAKDVIKQVEARRLLAKSGNGYLVLSSKLWKKFESESTSEEAQVRDVLRDQKCTVCAIGAAFVAAVDRHDRLTVGDVGRNLDDREEMVDYLGEWFDENQLSSIEKAFETDPQGKHRYAEYVVRNYPYPGYLCNLFGTRERTAPKRLVAIMRNIIENGGTFVPEKDEYVQEMLAEARKRLGVESEP